MALNYITLVLDLADRPAPAHRRPGAAQPAGAAHRRHRRHDHHQDAASTKPAGSYPQVWLLANGTPRTTTRYDRARQNLDRHPNYILAAYMASGT
jgi:hypothetical protein